MKYWAFAVYSVLYELVIWGIFGYAVFIQGHSGWWMVLAVVMSASQMTPAYFDIRLATTKQNKK